MIEKEKNDYYELNRILLNVMEFKDYDDELNRSIYNSLRDMIGKYITPKINLNECLAADILDGVKEKSDLILYKQPMVLILYYLVQEHAKELWSAWQYMPDMIEPVYIDMGISIE